MSSETNKQTVLAFFAAMGRNDVETMGKLMTDDATWWVVPGTKFSGLWPKADYLSNIGLLYEIAAGPLGPGGASRSRVRHGRSDANWLSVICACLTPLAGSRRVAS